jgi:hypothetical protein
VLTFLRAVGAHPEIRLALGRVGYRKRDHEEGLALLAAALRFGVDDAALEAELARPRVDPRRAEAALRRAAKACLPRLRAALERHAPERVGELFDHVWPVAPEQVVPAMARFLDRLDRLDAADADLLALLARRGFDAEARAQARALVDEAEALGQASAVPLAFHVARERELHALWAWWAEWSAAAQSAVERADHRMLLGIARRRGGHAGGAGAGEGAAEAAE